jgi:hypothetical protein
MEAMIVWCGAGQLALAAASLAIPRALGWREELSRVSPLTRNVFWTYGAYIVGTNAAFGLVSVLAPRAILDGSTLARAVAGFIAVYWGARSVLQFTSFSRHAPQGLRFRVAEAALVALFLACTVVYGAVALGVRG